MIKKYKIGRKFGIYLISLINKLYFDDGLDQKDIGLQLNCDSGTISRIINGKIIPYEHRLNLKKQKMLKNIYPAKDEAIQAKILRAKREQLPSTKLTFKIVEKIRDLYYSGQYTQMELAHMYNMNQSTINRMLLAIKWKKIR